MAAIFAGIGHGKGERMFYNQGIKPLRGETPMHTYGDEEPGRAAGRVWSEGRANPLFWQVRTTLGTFVTEDRLTWRTPSGGWSAELRRSRNGRHWFLAPSCLIASR